MTIKNISGSFLRFFNLDLPDEEVTGTLNGDDLKAK